MSWRRPGPGGVGASAPLGLAQCNSARRAPLAADQQGWPRHASVATQVTAARRIQATTTPRNSGRRADRYRPPTGTSAPPAGVLPQADVRLVRWDLPRVAAALPARPRSVGMAWLVARSHPAYVARFSGYPAADQPDGK